MLAGSPESKMVLSHMMNDGAHPRVAKGEVGLNGGRCVRVVANEQRNPAAINYSVV